MTQLKENLHPEVPTAVLNQWQKTADTIATELKAPATLIMQVIKNNISVLISSKTSIKNPYEPGATKELINSGLYCETVIRENASLFVPNALEDENWKDNPDVKLNMINYIGFPIRWPNGDPFGTICILDSKTHHYSDEEKEALFGFSKSIEEDLRVIEETGSF